MDESEGVDAKPAEPVQSIEVETAKDGPAADSKEGAEGQAKGEGAGDDNVEDDAEAEDEDAPGEESDGRPVSRNQYKALKDITDALTNHKTLVKNE
jgi:hypothetical protein